MFRKFFTKKAPPADTLLEWSGQDFLTLEQACSGIHIFGATGSGKTTTSFNFIKQSLLNRGLGGLFLTSKPSDTSEFLHTIEQCGRTQDVIIVSPEHPENRFNPLDYELHRGGKGAGYTENIVNLLTVGIEATEQGAGAENEKFFHRAAKQMLRNAIELQIIALNKVSLLDTLNIISTAPCSLEQAEAEKWQNSSFCFSLIRQARDAEKNATQTRDFTHAGNYWLRDFPALADRTRSSIIATFTGMADSLVRGIFFELFCTDTTFTPDDCRKGKIVILDLNVKEFGEVGRLAQTLLLFAFQKRFEQQQGATPIFIAADEAQNFIGNHSFEFLSTARSANVCNIYVTQNIENYYAALGGKSKAEAQINAFLGNFTHQVFHANSNVCSNYYASELIAKIWQTRFNINSNHPNQNEILPSPNQNQNGSSGFSSNQSFEYELLPRTFTNLRTGGVANNFLVDAIIVKTGTPFSNGKNFMQVELEQHL